MDLTNQQIKDTYGNVLTIGATAGSPQTGTLQNGEGLNITSATLTGGTVTTSNPLLDMTQTWNDAGVTFTSLKLNVTDTASGGSSLLLDLQVGGSSVFKVTKGGSIRYTDTANALQGIEKVSLYNQSNSHSVKVNNYGIWLRAGTASTEVIALKIDGSSGNPVFREGFSFSSDPLSSNGDVFVFRDAANTLGQRTGTNAQTFNIYNTYTDASNYERGFLKWDSNELLIGTEALGTGTALNVKLQSAGSILYFGSGGNVQWTVDSGRNLAPASAGATLTVGTDSAALAGTYFKEVTAPSSPSSNRVVVYAEDNGSGKTRLMALFQTGVAQQIAIEP